ncbi:hypothetical protein LAZ67_1004850 [Cordylochernes scorpioides]|uniref:Peptidase A2 domain-containing protein n=1 Tax=Cordylochernes scorpioides TaxID=51811 RepID=A0ABY6JXP5_9ARAC|nr:hypothetical protein LAZ67_1004850 [Cordylochernes scorpioides]
MSFAEFFFVAKKRITDRNSQLAGDTRGSSITNGCSAKTKLTSDVSLMGNWSGENKLRVRAVGSSLKAILMTVVPRGTYLTDNPRIYALGCKITATCKVCNKKHHTTLHSYNYQRRQGPISTTEHQANTSVEQNQHQTVNHTVLSNNTSIIETNIFLSTALIKVFNPNNDELMCRALIDSGAQKSLITKTLADKLNIAQEHTKVKIAGFNSTMQSQVNKIIKIKLSSIYDHFKFETKALIVKDLSNKIPNFYTHNPVWPHLNNLKLADPEF